MCVGDREERTHKVDLGYIEARASEWVGKQVKGGPPRHEVGTALQWIAASGQEELEECGVRDRRGGRGKWREKGQPLETKDRIGRARRADRRRDGERRNGVSARRKRVAREKTNKLRKRGERIPPACRLGIPLRSLE